MARVGFLGLGDMGTPMARRLLRAGHDLVVWNRSPERTVGLAQEGAAVAPSPAQAVVGADFIITMVATPEALEQVLFGTAGLAASLLPGQVVIDMSTVGPDEIRSVSARLPKSAVLDTLADSPIGPMVGAKRTNVESGQFAPTFKLRHAAKDLRLVVEAAAARGRDLKQARANRTWLDEAAEHGAADLDFSAVVATIAEMRLSTIGSR